MFLFLYQNRVKTLESRLDKARPLLDDMLARSHGAELKIMNKIFTILYPELYYTKEELNHGREKID